MRCLAFSVLAVTACGATDDGAHLTFVAPADLGPAGRIEIMLASADPTYIERIDHQRTAPRSMTDETVTYYRQAASGGVVEGPIDSANGFTIRITPNAVDYPDDQYIPFVLIYGAGGDVGNANVVGIGTFHAGGDPTPQPIKIRAGEIDAYSIDVQPVASVDGSAAIAARQALVVDCGAQTGTWRSGFAWRGASGPEVRVLLPDVASNPGAKDALSRMLDLDCDAHPASETDARSDCDDTRARYNHDAAEQCDGEDTNCDGAQYWVGTCTPPTGAQICVDPANGMGVELCDDTTGTAQCTSDPACLCAAGQTGNGCVRCFVDHLMPTTTAMLTPCQPGVGLIKLEGSCTDAAPCEVRVLAVRGGWEALVAANSQAAFDDKATGVGAQFLLKAARPEGPGASIPGLPGHVTGEVDLVVIDAAGKAHFMGVELDNALDFSQQCPTSNGVAQMTCVP